MGFAQVENTCNSLLFKMAQKRYVCLNWKSCAFNHSNHLKIKIFRSVNAALRYFLACGAIFYIIIFSVILDYFCMVNHLG